MYYKYEMIILNFELFRLRCLSFPLCRYLDVESESDDEVDWKALAKAIEEYQTLNGWYSFLSNFATTILQSRKVSLARKLLYNLQ